MFDLNPDLNWYVILNSTSECQALEQFYLHNGTPVYKLWKDTPYEEWNEVMPLIAQVDSEHNFLTWALHSDDDWGMIVSSEHELDTVLAHFRSLTQIWLPSGTHAFFRFYDPDFGIKIARYCNDEQRAELMGPTIEWLGKGQKIVNIFPSGSAREKAFPWWHVPREVMDQYTSDDKSTFIANCLKWLKESHADLYFYFPERILTAKVTHLVQRYRQDNQITINEFLHQTLSKEVYR